MNDKLYKSSLVFLFVLCFIGIYFIYNSRKNVQEQAHFYNGKVVDYDLSMLNAYESAELIQSKKLKRSLFKTKAGIIKKALKPVKKVDKERKKKTPFPKIKIKGIVYSANPKAIVFVQNKERIMTEGETIAKWELNKINKSELLFSLGDKTKRIPFGAQEFSQEGSSAKGRGRSRPRFGSGPSGFPR